jgi:cell division protein FtsW
VVGSYLIFLKSGSVMSKKLPRSLQASLLASLTLLCLIGLFFVFEASTAESFAVYGHQYHFLKRQAIWLAVGMAGFIGVQFIPTKFWQKFGAGFYFLGLALLIATLMPGLGLELNGARRWLLFGSIQFQPVELFKLGLLTFFAAWLSEHQRILPFLFLTVLPGILLLIQPDMGSLLVLLMIAGGMFFVAGGNLKQMLPIAVLAVLGLSLAIVTSPYRLKRIKTFFNPEIDPLGASFQVRQITLALGSGGWFGQGLGNSQQKYAYIPEASSDSIFAIVAEEIGFVGSLIILGLYAIYFYSIFQISQHLPEGSFAQLFSTGLLLWIAGQTLLNLAAIVVLVPLTGLPLPFFSYGGSSLVSMLLANGILVKSWRSQK